MDTKRRTPNFSRYEMDILLELVGANASVLENKRTDGCSVKEKQAMWSHVEAQFNSTPGVTIRSADRLKTCYENMKRRLRKDLAEENVEIYKTGGGKPVSKTKLHETKLLEIVGTSLKPLNNVYDSDAQFNMIVDLDVDVVNTEPTVDSAVQCTDNENDIPPSSVLLNECTQLGTSQTPDRPITQTLKTPQSIVPDVTQVKQVSQAPVHRKETPTSKWHHLRMPAKPRQIGSGTVVDNVCKKRVEVLEAQLEMLKAEHQKEMKLKNCEMKIKNLKILT